MPDRDRSVTIRPSIAYLDKFLYTYVFCTVRVGAQCYSRVYCIVVIICMPMTTSYKTNYTGLNFERDPKNSDSNSISVWKYNA